MLDLRIIDYGSCEYQEMVKLRTEVYVIHGNEFIEVGIPHYEMRKNPK